MIQMPQSEEERGSQAPSPQHTSPTTHQVRIDKWLWSVRAFKTRTQATDACRAGKVKIDDVAVKPSREVRVGMLVMVQTGPIQRQLLVLALLQKRIGAKLVPQYMQDQTPEEEYKKLELIRAAHKHRPRGSGRPTKKERRDMDTWLDWD
jgi:ribosome-associated heat shock protein Hsp15